MNSGPLSPDEQHELQVMERALWLQNVFGMSALRAADVAEDLVDKERQIIQLVKSIRWVFVPEAAPKIITIGEIKTTDFNALCEQLRSRRLGPPSQQ